MRMATEHRRTPILTIAAGALLGLSMILLMRRYMGINHDAVVYLGQALLRRAPAIYGQDLFFVHGGSQDQYTLFPWLASHALDWIDPPTVFMWSALSCLLLFALAGWFCLKALLPPGQRYWAWLGAICLPTFYGRTGMFSYSEQFFTPRPIAELLCLFGIGLLARRNWLGAAGCLTCAALFHPLQALTATIVVWAWAVTQDRRWLHAAWLGLPVLALAAGGVAPFAKLLLRADATWLWILRDNNPQLFLTKWTSGDFKVLAFDALALAYGAWALDRRFGDWCRASFAGLALGMVANLVLVDALHLVLPAGLQPWRVQWVAHWFAMAAVASLLYRDVQERNHSRVPVLALAALLAWGDGTWAWLLLAFLYAFWQRTGDAAEARIRLLISSLCGLGIAIALASYVYSEFTAFRFAQYRLEFYAIDRRLLVFPIVGLGLPLLGVVLWGRLHPVARRWLFWCLLCPTAVLSSMRWDARPPQVVALEQTKPNSALFGLSIPVSAQVLWGYDMPLATWMILQRASYFSAHQLSGQVFSREMAIDGRARLNRLYPLLGEYRACKDPAEPPAERDSCHISEGALRQACGEGIGRPPDYLVLPYAQPQSAVGEWTTIDPVTHDVLEIWRLYRCTDVMADLQSATGMKR